MIVDLQKIEEVIVEFKDSLDVIHFKRNCGFPKKIKRMEFKNSTFNFLKNDSFYVWFNGNIIGKGNFVDSNVIALYLNNREIL